jgi:hypothetical protein
MNFNNDSHQIETLWIEKIALEELDMQQTGVVNFNSHLNLDRLLEDSSIELMNKLRELFEIYAGKFNQLRTNEQDRTQAIKIFKIANTANDFMLFRNSLKLVIARRAVDSISIGFLSHSGNTFGARLDAQNIPSNIHDIRAHVGAFNKISWKFQGETVDINALVKHYLTEFLRQSAQ